MSANNADAATEPKGPLRDPLESPVACPARSGGVVDEPNGSRQRDRSRTHLPQTMNPARPARRCSETGLQRMSRLGQGGAVAYPPSCDVVHLRSDSYRETFQLRSCRRQCCCDPDGGTTVRSCDRSPGSTRGGGLRPSWSRVGTMSGGRSTSASPTVHVSAPWTSSRETIPS